MKSLWRSDEGGESERPPTAALRISAASLHSRRTFIVRRFLAPSYKMENNQPSSDSSRENSLFLRLVYWHKLFESDSPPRLGIDVEKRIPYATTSAFTTGALLGYYYGSKRAGLRFRAENAHRFPTTSSGWFQYHKTKNYISVVGGVKDGAKMGCKLAAGALAFCLFEETVDYARHDERDFLSTVTAGLSFSGIYSLLGKDRN